MLWHIMKIYSQHGEFIICCGYKRYLSKEYFANYFLHMPDVTFDMANNKMCVHENKAEPWKITLVDTGEDTATGGRLKRIKDYLIDDEFFCFTYGDGLIDTNISATIAFHKSQKTLGTVTATYPQARFGVLNIDGDRVISFQEKPKGDNGMVNGGYFVLSPKVIDYIDDDQTSWEGTPLERLAHEGQLSVYKHEAFWQPMDTLRDKLHLEKLWDSGMATWKTW